MFEHASIINIFNSYRAPKQEKIFCKEEYAFAN